MEQTLEILAKTLELGFKVLGWAAILFITLVSAILNGGKGS